MRVDATTDADTSTERVDATTDAATYTKPTTTDAATNTNTTTTHDVATYADVVRRRPRRDVPPHARRTVAPVSPAAAAVTHTAPPPPTPTVTRARTRTRDAPPFALVLRKYQRVCRDHALHGSCREGALCTRDHGGVSEAVKAELRQALRERAAAPPRRADRQGGHDHRRRDRTHPAGARPPPTRSTYATTNTRNATTASAAVPSAYHGGTMTPPWLPYGPQPPRPFVHGGPAPPGSALKTPPTIFIGTPTRSTAAR